MKILTKEVFESYFEKKKNTYNLFLSNKFLDALHDHINRNELSDQEIDNLEELLISPFEVNKNMAFEMIGFCSNFGCRDKNSAIIHIIDDVLAHVFCQTTEDQIKSELRNLDFEVAQSHFINRNYCVVKLDLKDKNLKVLKKIFWHNNPCNSEKYIVGDPRDIFLILKKGIFDSDFCSKTLFNCDELFEDVIYLLENNFFDRIELSPEKQKINKFFDKINFL